MLNRDRVLQAFHQALAERGEGGVAKISPRSVAVRAHEIYCTGWEGKKPALVTFRKFVSGKSALPEVTALLNRAEIQPATRVRLDRHHLHQAFREAVSSFQEKVLMGRVKPLDIARKAHEIYSRSLGDGDPKPSRLTFHSLVYDKETDQEIQSLICGFRGRRKAQAVG